MATNKKPVTCYLSAQLEEELTKYCTNQGLVRYYSKEGKNKPQLGSAIAQILEQHFFGDELPEASESEKKSLTSEIGEIKQALQSLAQRVTDLETNSNGLSTGESTTPFSLESNVPSTKSSQGLNVTKSQGLSNEVGKEQPPKGNGVSTEASKRPNETEPDQSTVPSPVPSTGKVEASYSNVVGTKQSQGLSKSEVPEDEESSVSDDVPSQGLDQLSSQSESTEESQTPSTRPDETETDQSTASSNVPSKEEAELKDESNNESGNVSSPVLSTEEQQETPSILAPESKDERSEDISPSQEAETPQEANAEGELQDRWDDVNKSQGLEADTQTDAPSTNWMSAEETVAHLQGLGVSITKKKQLSDAVRSAKEESPEGYPKFSYRGYKFERRKYDSKTYQFRIVGRIDNSNTPQEQVISDSPQDSRGGLSGWLSHGQMRQWLAERGQEIGRRSLWKAAKKASSEGEKFTFKNMEFRRRTDEKGRKQYCCVSLVN